MVRRRSIARRRAGPGPGHTAPRRLQGRPLAAIRPRPRRQGPPAKPDASGSLRRPAAARFFELIP